MNRRLLFSAILLLACTAFGGDGDVQFSGGTCRRVDKGEFEVSFPKGSLRVAVQNVLKKWRFVPVDDVVSSMRVNDGKLELDFEAVNPAGLETQDSLPLLIVLYGDCVGYPNGLVRLGKGGKIATFSSRNVWGYGDQLEMDMFRQRIGLAETATLSFWKLGSDGKWSVRLHLRGEKRDDGTTHYKQRLTFSTEDVRIAKPIDMPALKRAQYLRTLSPPQEPPLDVSKWLEVCRNEHSKKEDFDRLEDLFDVRSALYSARDALKHRPKRDQEGESLVERGYAALARMDIAEARAAADALGEHVKNSSDWMPISGFPPLSWVKCWTQWGYVRADDGCSFLEPTPWNLAWQDGFRFCLAQDKRVAAANSKVNPNTWETRYLEPMPDVRVDRDWVSDRWVMPDGSSVTFSMLTPVVEVDGTDRLVLGGFQTAPDMLLYMGHNASPRFLRLTKEVQVEPEVIPSVLMDFKKPPAVEPPPTLGTIKINPADVASPWLALSSKQGGWRIFIFPGARPVSASWKNGQFVLEMESKSHVGVMRAPGNLHGPEQYALADFFAGVSVASPTACREERRDGVATWRYTYQERSNAWGTAPRRIAPVPPLADFAGLSFKGARATKMPTKWNLFKYVDGDTAACSLPAGMRREPSGMYGVNVSAPIDTEKTDPIMEHHPYWVRLVCGGRKDGKTIDEKCKELAEALEYCRRHSAKALIDSHGFKFYIDWAKGAVPSELKNFYEVWDAYSKVGAKYPDVVAGYDLYNEPGLIAGSEGAWRDICAKATAIVRANHPGAPVYYSAVYGGNPNGLFNLEPLPPECEPQVTTFHFYSPHSFTHQKMSTQNRGGDVCNYYPGWIPPIDWKGGNHWGGPGVSWGDRWMLAALMLPAFELYAQYGVPMHVGEFSVIGFANHKSSRSAYIWTKDTIDLFEHLGASWHLWNGGFGLGNERVRELVYGLWEKQWEANQK